MDNTTYLSLSAVQALGGMVAEVYAGNAQVLDVLANWSTGTVNAAASTYTVTSNALSTSGVVGQYAGSITFPYLKRDLGQLLPYPFVFTPQYPTNLATIQEFFLENFNIVIENGEFAVTGNTITGALNAFDTIDATPDPVSGHVTFVAQASSGRFIAGTSFSIRCTAKGVQIPLTTLLALTTAPDLGILSDH